MKKKLFWIKSSVIFIILVLLDQVTKMLAYNHLRQREPVPIIKDVFELQYLENQSAAFGKDPITIINYFFHMFDNDQEGFLRAKMIFLSVLTFVVFLLVIVLLNKIPDTKRFAVLNYALVVFEAGAIGNLIDRVWHNYVIDFFYFKLINFPIFNVADIYVTCTAFLFIFLGFYYKEEDFAVIFPPKKKKEPDNE